MIDAEHNDDAGPRPVPPDDWPLPRRYPNVVSFDAVLEGPADVPETGSAGDAQEALPAEEESEPQAPADEAEVTPASRAPGEDTQ